jgi:hypothetical protein
MVTETEAERRQTNEPKDYFPELHNLSWCGMHQDWGSWGEKRAFQTEAAIKTFELQRNASILLRLHERLS